MDRSLVDLVLDIQYRTQHYWYYELHRLYYDNQLRDAAQQRRRTNKFQECFRLFFQTYDQYATCGVEGVSKNIMFCYNPVT